MRVLRVKVREIGLCLRGLYIRRKPRRAPLDDARDRAERPLMNALVAAALWTVPGVGHWLAIYNLVLVASNLGRCRLRWQESPHRMESESCRCACTLCHCQKQMIQKSEVFFRIAGGPFIHLFLQMTGNATRRVVGPVGKSHHGTKVVRRCNPYKI